MLRPLLCCLAVAVAACQTRPPASAEQDLTLVLLKTGPAQGLTAEAQQQAFAGHFANMNRLARQGDLLLAGPFGKQRSDPARRGLFVLATGDRDAAQALAASDPAVQAGIFVLECHALRSAAPLRAFLAAELAAEDAMKAAGKTPAPGEFGRGFALLTCADGEAAAAALAGHPAVLLFARHDGHGAWVVLDAADLAAAQAIVAPLQARLGACTLDEWFASKRVAELPKLAGA